MTKLTKKLNNPVTVTVVFPDKEIECDYVTQIDEDEDGGVLLTRKGSYVRVNSNYLYYEVNFE